MNAPRLSWAEVRSRRLERHGLATPAPDAAPAGVVAAMAGTHAQVMSAAELAVGLRIDGATRTAVREALWTDRTLVKTFGPRGTVHLLPAADLGLWVGGLSAVPPMPGAAAPPGIRMTPEQTERVIDSIGAALAEDGGDLTIDELSDAVVERAGPWAGDLVMPAFQGMWPRWRQALPEAGTRGLLCFGPNRGRKVTYRAPRDLRPEPVIAALAFLVRSYLHAYGPSTPRRFAHWLAAPASWATELFTTLDADLQQVIVEGNPEWVWSGDTAAPSGPPRGVRLLPYFDGYAYRVGNQPPALLYPGKAADRVLPGNFQILLVDGEVAGLWHQRRSGRRLALTVEPLVTLTRTQRADLDDQVERVGHILEGRPEMTIGTVTVGGHA
ncbi:winged helix DNA-binding domain-containing protein [Spirillospora sp. CA-294931]|uniref:winged helix DNA-binding domain-containing protein n=1 Tax=Spirillospora sp. CA-294931 TaxID=3240042 RepID=UPI003D90506C